MMVLSNKFNFIENVSFQLMERRGEGVAPNKLQINRF
jgi:hypothetical protein